MVVSEKTIKARELFSRRLRELLEARDMNQNELAKVLHVSESTVGKWTLGKSMPRTMGVIQQIADFFNVGKSYLLEEDAVPGSHDDHTAERPYYLDPEVAEMANELKENPDMRILFDASRKLSKQDMKTVINMVKAITDKEE